MSFNSKCSRENVLVVSGLNILIDFLKVYDKAYLAHCQI